MFPVAWFESEETFQGSSIPSPKIERAFQPLIILVNKVYTNYNRLPGKPGEGCTIDYYIQQSLLNSIQADTTKTTRILNKIHDLEYNIKELREMARNIFNF